MYKEDVNIESYPDEQVIWRFLGLDKFLSILHRNELWFSCPSQFKDPWDGTYPLGNMEPNEIKKYFEQNIPSISETAIKSAVEGISKELENGVESNSPVLIKQDVENILRELISGFRKSQISNLSSNRQEIENRLHEYSKLLRDLYAVSCWYANDVEPDAFWSIYSDRSAGVAIRSTVGKLKSSFAPAEKDVFIGKVNYVDSGNSSFQGGILQQFFWKRRNFEYEREVRAVVKVNAHSSPMDSLRAMILGPEPGIGMGLGIAIDLHTLIDAVVISPLAPGWLLGSMLALIERFDKELKIEKSALTQIPE